MLLLFMGNGRPTTFNDDDNNNNYVYIIYDRRLITNYKLQ